MLACLLRVSALLITSTVHRAGAIVCTMAMIGNFGLATSLHQLYMPREQAAKHPTSCGVVTGPLCTGR